MCFVKQLCVKRDEKSRIRRAGLAGVGSGNRQGDWGQHGRELLSYVGMSSRLADTASWSRVLKAVRCELHGYMEGWCSRQKGEHSIASGVFKE